jgi:hypothetical protein
MSRPIVHLIPHTHWDREWYLPLGAFRARLVPMLDELLAQLEGDPRISSFLLDGQTVLLEDYLALCPERRDRVAALVRSGRLTIGPWYVLADEQIPAGESLFRNLLLGASNARALGGHGSVLYSPDAFGHPAALPLVGLEFGIDRVVLWRGVSAEATEGHDLARWEAADGRRVLVYHLPPDGYEVGSNLLVPRDRLADAWRRVAETLLPRAVTRHVALFVGADHHATTPDLGDLAGALGAVAPECEFRFSSLPGFLQAAAEEVDQVAVLRGEQRWSYGYTWTLQGVHAARAPLKRRHSMLELFLTRIAEPLAALAGPGAGTAAILRQAWREVVQSQFHDALCGCASDLVAAAVATRLQDAEAAAGEVIRSSLDRLCGHDPDRAREMGGTESRLVVWNSAARPRAGVCVAEVTCFRRDVLVGPPGDRAPRTGAGYRPFTLRTRREDGSVAVVAPQVIAVTRAQERIDAPRHYPDQDDVDRVRIAFPLPGALSGLTARTFTLGDAAGEPLEEFAVAGGRLLRNGRVELHADADGTAVLSTPGGARPFAGLLALESEGDAGDSYSFCPTPGDRIRRPARAGRPRITAPGPLVAGLEWNVAMRCGRGERGAPGRVAARIRVEAIGDSPVLRCCVTLNNQARDHRIRLRLPTGLTGIPALAGSQFGVVVRAAAVKPRGRYPAETPVPTAPAQRFVAAARGERGLALFAPGFFEYEWTPRGDLLVTLLRAVGELSRGDLATRPGHAGWPTPIPGAQCLGSETLRFGIAAVSAADLSAPGRLEQMWEDAFVPLTVRWIRGFGGGTTAGEAPGLQLEGEGLVFSALKPAEDGRGVVLRCYNLGHRETAGRIRVGRRPARADLVRADETFLANLPMDADGGVVEFTVGARGIASVRLEWVN